MAKADIAASPWIGPPAACGSTDRTVAQLPGFDEGIVSVQDAGAQLAARLLDAKPHMRVLDACAAPGGKTGHLLEYTATWNWSRSTWMLTGQLEFVKI